MVLIVGGLRQTIRGDILGSLFDLDKVDKGRGDDCRPQRSIVCIKGNRVERFVLHYMTAPAAELTLLHLGSRDFLSPFRHGPILRIIRLLFWWFNLKSKCVGAIPSTQAFDITAVGIDLPRAN